MKQEKEEDGNLPRGIVRPRNDESPHSRSVRRRLRVQQEFQNVLPGYTPYIAEYAAQTPDAGVASCKFLGNSDQPYSSYDGKQQLYADDASTQSTHCWICYQHILYRTLVFKNHKQLTINHF